MIIFHETDNVLNEGIRMLPPRIITSNSHGSTYLEDKEKNCFIKNSSFFPNSFFLILITRLQSS